MDMNQVVIPSDVPPEVLQELQKLQNMESADQFPLPLVIVACLIIVAVGLWFIRAPDMVWELQHLLSVKDGEPTDFYLISTRISGVILIIVGIVLLIMAIASYI